MSRLLKRRSHARVDLHGIVVVSSMIYWGCGDFAGGWCTYSSFPFMPTFTSLGYTSWTSASSLSRLVKIVEIGQNLIHYFWYSLYICIASVLGVHQLPNSFILFSLSMGFWVKWCVIWGGYYQKSPYEFLIIDVSCRLWQTIFLSAVLC